MNEKALSTAVRKSPLYHNCFLQAPDGQDLCTCDIRKAKWYISKGIGFLVSEDPYTVRLKFEPSGRPEGLAGKYYTTVNENICVVCGKVESLLRKNIIPHEYRKYFPAVMKDHQSHDILLLCVRCHQASNMFDAELRRRLAERCAAPIGTEADVKLRENSELRRVRSAGRALQADRGRERIPATRRAQLEAVLLNWAGAEACEKLSEQLVDRAADCCCMEENEEYVPHSRAVVQQFLQQGGLLQLEVLWRQHFIDKMKPAHLPHLWSVNHQEERLGVKAAENRIDTAQYRLATEGTWPDGQYPDLEAYRHTNQTQLGVNPNSHN